VGTEKAAGPVAVGEAPIHMNTLQISFDTEVSEIAKKQFNSDIKYVTQVLNKSSIGKLINCSIQLANHLDTNEYNDTAGIYTPATDIIQISLRAGTKYDNSYKAVLLHELGHRFHIKCRLKIPKDVKYDFPEFWNAVYILNKQFKPGQFPTPYAATNYVEFWAESFMLYHLGKLQKSQPKLSRMVKNTINNYRDVLEI
jgi:hypothetical protein